MDHFALPTDALALAFKEGSLHRNFMGYTHQYTRVLLGLGMSSISDSWSAFAQNEKHLEAYTDLVQQGILPVSKGHILSKEDQNLRKHITHIMCQFLTRWEQPFEGLDTILALLKPLEEDGLVALHPNGLEVTAKGQPFVRNVCMAFDARLQANKPDTQLFSMTV